MLDAQAARPPSPRRRSHHKRKVPDAVAPRLLSGEYAADEAELHQSLLSWSSGSRSSRIKALSHCDLDMRRTPTTEIALADNDDVSGDVWKASYHTDVPPPSLSCVAPTSPRSVAKVALWEGGGTFMDDTFLKAKAREADARKRCASSMPTTSHTHAVCAGHLDN